MDTTLFSQSDWEAILELRHTLHAHPELSGEEQETKKRLMDFISHHTHLQLVDRGSWFYALYEPKKRNGKPAIGFRADLTQCASKGLIFRFTGKRAHAGTPEQGNSPAPALAKLTLFAQDLVPKMATGSPKTLLLTLVGLNVGGKDFGIAPGEGEVSFTLRADEEDDLAALERQLRQEAARLADADGLQLTVTEADPFPATVNHKAYAEKVRQAARDLGLQLAPMEKPWRPSEDFGWYLKVCPGAMFYVGNGETWPAPHHPQYDFNDRILATPAKVFLRLAED